MNIDPNKFYNFSEIARAGFFQFKDRRTYKSIILSQKTAFRTVITGTGRGRVYLVKGKYLIENVKYF